MSDLPDVEATVNLLKAILSKGVDLASEKRRFQAFLRDYAGCARAEQGLKLERRHLNVLVQGMRYQRFDGLVKGRGDAAGLVGLGDWLAREEGYDKGLCQWVEVVWSKSLGSATDIELDSKAGGRRAEEEKRHQAQEQARRQAVGSGRVSRPVQGVEVFRGRLRSGGVTWECTYALSKQVEVFRGRLRSGGEGLAMVVLPTGSFRMGSPAGEAGRWGDEGPVHTVTISRPIAMGRYPVTFEDYDLYVSAMGAERPDDEGWGRGRRPVINVSWRDAKAYAAWLSEPTGKRYRLPSESEWEYAARAGTETAYSWGDEIGVNRANCRGSGSEWSGRQTSPVGSFEPNAFGLYDMHGNVREWVEDCWHDNYEGAPSYGRAWTSGGDSSKRVVRGGSWNYGPRDLRSAYRSWFTPSGRNSYIGFRLVQDLNP